MMHMIAIIAEQIALHLPLVLGAYLSINIMKVADLALEAAFVVGALTGALTIQQLQQYPMILQLIIAVSCSILSGALVGICSSTLTYTLRISPLLSSIISLGIWFGLIRTCCAYISLSTYANPLTLFALHAQHPELGIIMIIGILLCGIVALLLKTQLGAAWAIYGNNPHFFQHYGISRAYVMITGALLSNALAACSGYLYAQSNGFFEITMGTGKILLSITLLMIGNIIFAAYKRSLLIPLGGIVLYFALQQLLISAGLGTSYFSLIQAIIIVLLLLVSPQQRTLLLGIS